MATVSTGACVTATVEMSLFPSTVPVIVAEPGATAVTIPFASTVATPELPTNLYRLDPKSGRATVVAGEINRPNGLAFSPDEKTLYVIESQPGERAIYAFDVADGVKLGNSRILIKCTKEETPDGFRVDVDGNLWCGWGMGTDELDGVRIFNPEGKPIGHISLPERCANVCFGGRYRNRLFMAASHSLYALYVNTQGVAGG